MSGGKIHNNRSRLTRIFSEMISSREQLEHYLPASKDNRGNLIEAVSDLKWAEVFLEKTLKSLNNCRKGS